MPDITKLTEYGLTGVCIALIVVGAWMFKEWLKYMKCQDKRHEAQYKAFQKVIERNTKVNESSLKQSKETLDFLKNLNGSLRKAVQEHKNEIPSK